MIISVHRQCCQVTSVGFTHKAECQLCQFLNHTSFEEKGGLVSIRIQQAVSTYNAREADAIKNKRRIIRARKKDIEDNKAVIFNTLKGEVSVAVVEHLKYLAGINETHLKEIEKLENIKETQFNYERYNEEIHILAHVASQIKIKCVLFSFVVQSPLTIFCSKNNIKNLTATTSNLMPIYHQSMIVKKEDISLQSIRADGSNV